MRRRHHLDAALRSFSPAKKASVSTEAPSLLLLSPAPLSSSLATCRYQSQRSPATIIINEKRCILSTFPATRAIDTSHRQRMCRPAANPPFPPNSGRLFDRAQDGLSTRATSDASRGPGAVRNRLTTILDIEMASSKGRPTVTAHIVLSMSLAA